MNGRGGRNALSLRLEQIGEVRSAWTREGPQVARDKIVSRLVFSKKYRDALTGIEKYSHALVIFWFHEVKQGDFNLKMRAKRGVEGPLVGIFATRSYKRPNPLGLAVVEIVRRRGNVLTVRGLDAFDGSPILDVKPYDHLDRKPEIRVPEWKDC